MHILFKDKIMDKSDSSEIQCYYCLSVTCHVVVPAKAKHDRVMEGRTDDGRNASYFSDTQ